MSPSAEKLAEIDAELDSFGIPEPQLADVVRRAVELSAELAGDDALAELVAGAREAVAGARAAAKAARPPRPASPRAAPRSSTRVGAPAPAVDDDEDEPMGSGLVEIPEEELRRADLPPVLDLGDADAFPSSIPAPSGELDQAFGSAAVSDIHGLSVDELFDDAGDAPPPSSGSHDLAELFAEEEPIRLSDPALDLESIADGPATEAPAPPRPRTVPPPVPPGALARHQAAARPPRLDAGVFPDEETDETMVGSLADLTASDDSFELLVDEDVLELEDVEPEASAEGTEPPAGDEEGERKGGLISRILGRK